METRLLAARGMQCPLDALGIARDGGEVGFGRLIGLRAALFPIPQSSKRDPESCGKFLLDQREGVGWRGLQTEKSVISRRESFCRGAESSRSMEKSERPRGGEPDFSGALQGTVAGPERSSAVGSLGTPGARRASLCARHELIRSSQRVHCGDAEVTT